MEKGIKITPSSCSNFSNALHAQFHNQIYRLIDQWEVMLEVINVSDDLMKEWRKLIDTEIDINREVQASSATKALTDLDKERDDLIVYLFGVVRSTRRSPMKAQKDAAERLYLITKQYSGLQNEGYEEETIHIDGLVHDLKKAANLADINTLNLGVVLDTLAEKNDQYRLLRSERTADRAASKLPPAKEIRPQNDAIYDRVCQLIEVSYLICKNPADKDEIAKLADHINQQIAEIRTAWKQSKKQSEEEKPTHKPRREKEDAE